MWYLILRISALTDVFAINALIKQIKYFPLNDMPSLKIIFASLINSKRDTCESCGLLLWLWYKLIKNNFYGQKLVHE